MIIALSGRRVDRLDATQARFPLSQVEQVGILLRRFLEEHQAKCLVSSAACGADLLGLAEAGKLGIRRRVVLPFARKRFRETSVVDRPGDWGRLYDSIMEEVESSSDVLMLSGQDEERAYEDANHAILGEALSQARASEQPAIALMVWEGKSRGKGDVTEAFGTEARRCGLKVEEILTIPGPNSD